MKELYQEKLTECGECLVTLPSCTPPLKFLRPNIDSMDSQTYDKL